jgi:tRNA G46 methylase TrmB
MIPKTNLDIDGIIEVSAEGFYIPRANPIVSLEFSANLFEELDGKVIVEIGTGIHGGLAGDSMFVWANKTNAKKIYAIDLDEERLREVETATRASKNIYCIQGDGIKILESFNETIDLLYLDFWVPDEDKQFHGEARAEAYKKAFWAAKDKMSERAMILIDDTDHIHPWKHTYIIPDARKNGYRVVYTGRQTLLMKNYFL